MQFTNKDFNLQHTFDCGQCFRWDMQEDGTFVGVIGKNVVKISSCADVFDIDCEDAELINNYFDLNRNYTEIKETLSLNDTILQKAIPLGYGIRLLKQDPWETLVSFIISANNNIPRIKKIINSLCTNFGEQITEGYFTFPTADVVAKLDISDLDIIKSGFRAKYILDAATKVRSGEINLSLPFQLDTKEAREYLKLIKGVGNKVADCILLFAYQKFDVFPKDVWTKRVLNQLYSVEEKDFDNFVKERFGNLAGFAQQYLFYYMRG